MYCPILSRSMRINLLEVWRSGMPRVQLVLVTVPAAAARPSRGLAGAHVPERARCRAPATGGRPGPAGERPGPAGERPGPAGGRRGPADGRPEGTMNEVVLWRRLVAELLG